MVARLLKLLLVSVILLGAVGVVRAAPASNLLGYQYVHFVTSKNTVSSSSILDHPLLNGNPNAIFFVTHNWNPGGVGNIYNNYNIGVFFDGIAWRIYNLGFEYFEKGASFNVFIPTPGANVFVHTAAVGNTTGNATRITHPLTDGDPSAMLLITPNLNPGGGPSVLNNSPVGVYYTGAQWAVFNQNTAVMTNGASFNVMVLPAGAGFVHTATSGNTSFNTTRINNPLTDNRPNALLFITPNWNPGGVGGTYVNFPVGVYYSSFGQAAIFNENVSGSMPIGAAFNVLALPPRSESFVHRANSTNTLGNSTELRNPLPNADPNVLFFATQNWNPGGAGGTYNNRNIGVWFDASWLIFNQNGANMPDQASFNVLARNPDAASFIHTATAYNTSSHITTIEHPLLSGNPNAIVIVTPNWNPGGSSGVYNDHPIGVQYSNPNWTIINQDLANIPLGAAFNVTIPSPGFAEAVFVHRATPATITGNNTAIDHPLANNNPDALLLVTPNYNPGDSCPCVGFNAAYGVYYQNSTKKWAIFNQNILGGIPWDAAFNIYILGKRTVYLPLIIR
jgi:hypothetical protein